MAYYDPLTDYPTGLCLNKKLPDVLRKKILLLQLLIWISIILRILKFLGHQAGDVFKVFQELKKVEDKTFVARLGGDEFAILFNSSCHEDIMEEVGKLLSYINRYGLIKIGNFIYQ